MVNPKAGAAIESLCACVIRGNNTPLLLKLISNPAEGSGRLPLGLILIPPIWQNAVELINMSRKVNSLFID